MPKPKKKKTPKSPKLETKNGSPKIFPQADIEERNTLGIQSPLPTSPLPPKNVPLTMDTLIPFADETTENLELAKTTTESTGAGKSVITGQVRTGWL